MVEVVPDAGVAMESCPEMHKRLDRLDNTPIHIIHSIHIICSAM